MSWTNVLENVSWEAEIILCKQVRVIQSTPVDWVNLIICSLTVFANMIVFTLIRNMNLLTSQITWIFTR